MTSFIEHKMLKVSLNEESGINSLFVECLLNIFEYLSEEEILSVGNVCVEWKALSTQTTIWQHSAEKGVALGTLEGKWVNLIKELQTRMAKLRAAVLETYANSPESLRQQLRTQSEKKFSEVLQKFKQDIGTHLLRQVTQSYSEVFQPESTTMRASYVRHQKARTEILRHLISVQDLANSDEIGQLDDNPFVSDLDLRLIIMGTTAEMIETLLKRR
eukprot:Phypoly_transcript_17888.p1 GENE.Phypoly_transcript_17888~~Phypoly_transcript_17888.p1  ORF type:complete len:229 (-),score=27.21 Phypoly_transcript_17888:104-751(-)